MSSTLRHNELLCVSYFNYFLQFVAWFVAFSCSTNIYGKFKGRWNIKKGSTNLFFLQQISVWFWGKTWRAEIGKASEMTTPLMTYLENEGKKTKQLGTATIWWKLHTRGRWRWGKKQRGWKSERRWEQLAVVDGTGDSGVLGRPGTM